MNVPRRHEPVATDTIFSDTPAVDSGVKQAQVFVGRDSLVPKQCQHKSFEFWNSGFGFCNSDEASKLLDCFPWVPESILVPQHTPVPEPQTSTQHQHAHLRSHFGICGKVNLGASW